MAKGIKSFKKGMSDDEADEDARTVEHRADETVATARGKGNQGLIAPAWPRSAAELPKRRASSTRKGRFGTWSCASSSSDNRFPLFGIMR